MYVAFVVFFSALAATQAIQQGGVLQNEANEFFVGFGYNPSQSETESELILSVTTSSQDTVRFTVDTLSDFTYNGTVSMDSPANVVIPQNFMVTDGSSSQRQKGIHVKAEGNKTVAVFGMNRNNQTTDAYLALPCSRLPVVEYEYYAVTYDYSAPPSCYPFALLVGCENSTTITSTGQSSFTLNRLETHLLHTPGVGCIGTRFVTDNPVAFFSGHECATVKLADSQCGHLVEQLPPTSTWGTFFLGSTGVGGVPGNTIFYIVFAAHDETLVTITCNSSSSDLTRYTISIRGTYFGFTPNGTSPNTFCAIETNNPVLVMEIQSIMGTQYDWKSFMSLLPPADQYNNDYFLPFGNLKYEQYKNYVTISVLPQYFDKKKIYVDNCTISKPWTSVKCSNGTICGYATTVSAGQSVKHLDRDAKIGVIVFGTGEYDAYGCPAGFCNGSNDQLVSSSTAALPSSAGILLSTTQLQPVLTGKVPQPTYSSTLNFHTLHTVLPSSSQYKPTESSPAGSTTPEFSLSVTQTSSANFEHTTVYQTALVTPSVSPTPADPHPIAVGSLLEIVIPVISVTVGLVVCAVIACVGFISRRFRKKGTSRQQLENESLLNKESEDSVMECPILPPCADPKQRPRSTHRGTKPALQELLQFTCNDGRVVSIPVKIGTKYDKFGIFLLNDSDGSRVDIIAHKNLNDAEQINKEIILKWLNGSGKKPVNWATLVEVLRDIELSTLAGDIETVKC